MSEASPFAFDELPRGAGGVGATEEIARVLEDSGIDAPSSLYDEALALARQGRLAPSSERLRMLLCLDPSDAQAALLLGKVLAGRGQWQEAMTRLDAASANGAVLPAGLRDEVETRLRQEIADSEAHRERVVARERGEIKGLRAEAKRLRSDNAAMEAQIEEMSRRIRIWSGATALVAGSACALLLVSLLFGGGDSAAEVDALALAPSVAQIDAPAVAAPAPASVVAPPVAQKPAAAAPAPAAKTPAAAAPVAPKAAAPRVHVVASGDTLGKLAARYLGSSTRWPEIQKANKDILGNSEALKLGMKLKIPAA